MTNAVELSPEIVRAVNLKVWPRPANNLQTQIVEKVLRAALPLLEAEIRLKVLREAKQRLRDLDAEQAAIYIDDMIDEHGIELKSEAEIRKDEREKTLRALIKFAAIRLRPGAFAWVNAYADEHGLDLTHQDQDGEK